MPELFRRTANLSAARQEHRRCTSIACILAMTAFAVAFRSLPRWSRTVKAARGTTFLAALAGAFTEDDPAG